MAAASPLALQAADKDGRSAVKGVGRAPCSEFVKVRENRAQEYMLFGGWIDGYMTGFNQFAPETYDMAPWESTELLAALLENHCRQNPEESFGRAVVAMHMALREDRLQSFSEMQVLGEGDQRVGVYKETLRQAQSKLKQEGVYSGAPDGIYGPGTKAAFEAYQRKNSLQVTGLPDQPTLLKLFRGIGAQDRTQGAASGG
jgi:hypothetical protein